MATQETGRYGAMGTSAPTGIGATNGGTANGGTANGGASTRAADAGEVGEVAKQAFDTAKQEAGELASRAADQGRSMLARQKDSAAGHLDAVAHALEGTARQLGEEQEASAGRYVDYAARQLQSLGRTLRDKDVDTLMHDAQDLGRRAPGAFFAGSVVAGFLLSRFLKSSGERQARPGRPGGDPYRSDPYRSDPYPNGPYRSEPMRDDPMRRGRDDGGDLRSAKARPTTTTTPSMPQASTQPRTPLPTNSPGAQPGVIAGSTGGTYER